MVNSEVDSKSVKKILNPFSTFAGDVVKEGLKEGDRIEIAPKCRLLFESSHGAHELLC